MWSKRQARKKVPVPNIPCFFLFGIIFNSCGTGNLLIGIYFQGKSHPVSKDVEHSYSTSSKDHSEERSRQFMDAWLKSGNCHSLKSSLCSMIFLLM